MRENIRYFTHYFDHEENEPFIIEIAGKTYPDKSYHVRRDCSQIYVLEYILSGKGTLQIYNHDSTIQTYYPKKGDVYLLHPNTRYYYFSDSDTPWTKLWINCKGPVVSGLISAYNLGKKILFPKQEKLKSSFEQIYALMKNKNITNQEIIQETEIIVHKILQTLGTQATANQKKKKKELYIVKEYIDSHIEKLITIQEIAQLIYRSPDYLTKHFKAEFGQTPYQYLLEKKMEVACFSLTSTNLPVSNIAESLGYYDTQYFSGLFKKKIGLPPLEYRKQAKQRLRSYSEHESFKL